MSSESGIIDAGGFKLRYRIEGAGIPAIVIGSARYYPRVFSQHLREHLRADLPRPSRLCSGTRRYRPRLLRAGNVSR